MSAILFPRRKVVKLMTMMTPVLMKCLKNMNGLDRQGYGQHLCWKGASEVHTCIVMLMVYYGEYRKCLNRFVSPVLHLQVS